MTTEKPPSPSMTTHVRCQAGGTHVWTDADGRTHGVLYLDPAGDSSLNFHDVSQVRDLIARLAGLAGEMDAEITRQQQADTGWRDEATGLISGPLPRLACARCGATDTPLVGYGDYLRCNESHRCAERVAERDADAAQVTR